MTKARKRTAGKAKARTATMRFEWTGVVPDDAEARRLRADLAGRAMQALVGRGANVTVGALPGIEQAPCGVDEGWW
ncbi:MAG: hypothetical protein AAB368_16910, partial [bacterium]